MRFRKLLLFPLILLILLAIPTIAFANSPAPNPNHHEILIDDYTSVKTLTIFGIDIEGNREVIDEYPRGINNQSTENTRVASERIIDFYNYEQQYSAFQIEIENPQGEIALSNIVDFINWSNYNYSTQDNRLQVSDGFASRSPHFFTVIGWIFALALPFGLTILLEWLVALIFKIKPSRYVCFTNLVSNPLMNIIIIFAMSTFMVSYFWLVLILELIVLGFEFLYYTRKYKDISKLRLLLFAVAANAVSYGAYTIISGLFY